jgi:predicted DNA-binding ribbon-helix-helix protein
MQTGIQTTVTKRSIVLSGRKTSISLEDQFWDALKAIARHHQRTLSALVSEIDLHRRGNLSSAIRVFVFESLCTQLPGATSGNGETTDAASVARRASHSL